MRSSFKKRSISTDAAQSDAATPTSTPGGVRVSPYNSSLLLSSGVASLDDILGGGVPAGSILLLEEDADTSYAKLLLRYWVAQGLVSGHRVCLVSSSLDATPEAIIAKLPHAEDDSGAKTNAGKIRSSSSTRSDDDDEGDNADDATDAALAEAAQNMKIAFRYQGLKKFQTSVSHSTSAFDGSQLPYCSMFDLTKTLDVSVNERADRLHTCDVYREGTTAGDPYNAALESVQARLSEATGPTRVAIQSITSLAWGEFQANAIYRFLMRLKIILREHTTDKPAAAVLTMPANHIRMIKEGSALLRRLEWACDAVIELESFADSPSLSAIFPTYSGFLHIRRLPTPNSLLPPSAKLSVLRGLGTGSQSTSSGAGGMDNNLGFKLRRKRGLVVETLHLDEGGGTNERRTTPAPTLPPHDVSSTTPTPLHTDSAQDVGDSVDTAQVENESNATASVTLPSTKVGGKKKLERRKIRFDDDPNENPSGILGQRDSAAPSHPNHGKSLRHDPALLDF